MILDRILEQELDKSLLRANVFFNDDLNRDPLRGVHILIDSIRGVGEYLGVSEYADGKGITFYPHRDISLIEVYNGEPEEE